MPVRRYKRSSRAPRRMRKYMKMRMPSRRVGGIGTMLITRPVKIWDWSFNDFLAGAANYAYDLKPATNAKNGGVAGAIGGAYNISAGIIQGTSLDQRIGHRIALRSIYYRATLVPSSQTSAVYPCKIRLLFVYDKQPNGTTASYPSVLGIPATGASQNCVHEFNNVDATGRFVILCDKTYIVANQYARSEIDIKLYCKLKGLVTQYTQNGVSGEATVQTGALLMYCLSEGHYDLVLANNTGPTLQSGTNHNIRVRFTDL